MRHSHSTPEPSAPDAADADVIVGNMLSSAPALTKPPHPNPAHPLARSLPLSIPLPERQLAFPQPPLRQWMHDGDGNEKLLSVVNQECLVCPLLWPCLPLAVAYSCCRSHQLTVPEIEERVRRLERVIEVSYKHKPQQQPRRRKDYPDCIECHGSCWMFPAELPPGLQTLLPAALYTQIIRDVKQQMMINPSVGNQSGEGHGRCSWLAGWCDDVPAHRRQKEDFYQTRLVAAYELMGIHLEVVSPQLLYITVKRQQTQSEAPPPPYTG